MPVQLQAFVRLVALKRLGVLLFVLAATLYAANTASAFEPAQTKICVWDFELAGYNSYGLLIPATYGKHQGNRVALSEVASGCLLGPEEALEQLGAKAVEKLVAKDAAKLFSTGETQGLKSLFGTGRKGAEEALKRVSQGARDLPAGVTRETLGRYKQQIIDKGLQDIPVQGDRLRIIEELLK